MARKKIKFPYSSISFSLISFSFHPPYLFLCSCSFCSLFFKNFKNSKEDKGWGENERRMKDEEKILSHRLYIQKLQEQNEHDLNPLLTKQNQLTNMERSLSRKRKTNSQLHVRPPAGATAAWPLRTAAPAPRCCGWPYARPPPPAPPRLGSARGRRRPRALAPTRAAVAWPLRAPPASSRPPATGRAVPQPGPPPALSRLRAAPSRGRGCRTRPPAASAAARRRSRTRPAKHLAPFSLLGWVREEEEIR